MLAFLVYVHLHGNSCFSEGEVEENAVFDGNDLVFGGVEKERGRGLAGDLKFVGEKESEGGIRLVAEQISS